MTLRTSGHSISNPAIYIRWSTEDQGEGTTLDVQLETCRAYIQGQGWPLCMDLLFVDEGISGAVIDRPALNRLRALIAQGQVDCVVVYKLDRLSRSVLHTLKLVLEEWDGRCAIKSAREPVDTLTAAGKMFFYQLMSFAEWERSVIRERTMAGRLRRAAEGRPPGFRLPYGYRKGANGQIEQDQQCALIVQHIFRLYLGGQGCRAVARQLNQEGIPAPTGGRWTQATIGDMLRNPAYIGTLRYGRAPGGDHSHGQSSPLIIKEDFYPVIIPLDLFAAVSAVRAERPSVSRGRGSGRSLGSKSLLTGLLRCTCGLAAIGITVTGRQGAVYRYYACTARQQSGGHRCDGRHIRQELLDALVTQGMIAFAEQTGVQTRLQSALMTAHTARQHTLQAGHTAVLAEQERLHEAEWRLYDFLLADRLSPEEYRRLQSALQSRRQANLQRQTQIETKLSFLDGNGTKHLVLDGPAHWTQLTPAEQKHLIQQFIAHITAYCNPQSGEVTCEIAWRSLE